MYFNGSMSAVSALGGCISYLKELQLERDLLTLRYFHLYEGIGVQENPDHLILDGKTIANLELFGKGYALPSPNTIFNWLFHL